MIKLGSVDVPFVFRGSELAYPDYVRDGLVLHYDFSGMSNSFDNRGVAKDLSGNGNDGQLNNFNYTEESGYDGKDLKFDGVDDYVSAPNNLSTLMVAGNTVEVTVYIMYGAEQFPRLFSTATGSLGRGGIAIYLDKYTKDYFQLTAMVDGNGNSRRGQFNYGKTYLITHVYTQDLKSIFYVNGTLLDERQYTAQLNTSDNAVIGWDASFSNARYGIEEFGAIRIYNRPLTPEEIAHNYQIEKERFNL